VVDRHIPIVEKDHEECIEAEELADVSLLRPSSFQPTQSRCRCV